MPGPLEKRALQKHRTARRAFEDARDLRADNMIESVGTRKLKFEDEEIEELTRIAGRSRAVKPQRVALARADKLLKVAKIADKVGGVIGAATTGFSAGAALGGALKSRRERKAAAKTAHIDAAVREAGALGMTSAAEEFANPGTAMRRKMRAARRGH